MLIFFLSLTLPGLDRRLLEHREGDAPPRVKEITEGQRDHMGAARRPEHAPLATGKSSSRAFVSFTSFRDIVGVFSLIIYMAFVTTLYHYLLYNLLCATWNPWILMAIKYILIL